jgi:hypothetical protein
VTSPHESIIPGVKTELDPRVPSTLNQIPVKIEIPEDTVCVFVSGSLVAGWGHMTSDVDLYVVTTTPAAIIPTTTTNLSLSVQPLPVVIEYAPRGVRYDIEYWTVAQVDELLAAVNDPGDKDYRVMARPGYDDIDCFYRLSIGVALTGDAWLRAAKERLGKSALPAILARVEFDEADNFVDDAVGLLQAGDQQSALLAARMALGHAVDGYLFGRGSLSPAAKWRYRKLAELPGAALTPEIFWSLETMRDLDPNNVRPWVERVLGTCQSLMMEVDFS